MLRQAPDRGQFLLYFVEQNFRVRFVQFRTAVVIIFQYLRLSGCRYHELLNTYVYKQNIQYLRGNNEHACSNQYSFPSRHTALDSGAFVSIPSAYINISRLLTRIVYVHVQGLIMTIVIIYPKPGIDCITACIVALYAIIDAATTSLASGGAVLTVLLITIQVAPTYIELIERHLAEIKQTTQ